MNKWLRITALVIIDMLLINTGFYCSLLLRFDGNIPASYLLSAVELMPVFTVVSIAIFFFLGLYNRVWQYASIGELVIVVYAVTSSTVLNTALAYFFMQGGVLPFPRSVFLLSLLMNVFLVGGSRLGWRLLRDHAIKQVLNSNSGKPVLIIGAGDTGVLVAKELKRHFNGEIRIVGFVDDDPHKHNLKVLGLPVLGSREKIPTIIAEHQVKEIILAIPSIPGSVVRDIFALAEGSDVKIKLLPGVYDLIEENVTVNHIREVQVEDLLGREPVKMDLEGISGYLRGQVVLVTGAGGSIGSELCRQVMKFSPATLLLLDVCENNMYDIEMELSGLDPVIPLVPLVKDVKDKRGIEKVFEQYKPQVVFHAAAHKHVPLMEINPEEAIKNNVLGTLNVAQAADRWGSKRFVLISTDKAVNPTSIMGASKRLAEIVIQHINRTSKTNYVAVRFGNVLASRGSVIPLFKKQIAEGGPVTVTHPEMVRYFMTIPEAVELVIQAGTLSQGGEIFILDMGEPVKILDLAKTLIRLSGFEPDRDIEIIFTGIRPGEKLFEELLTNEEEAQRTIHDRIFVAKANEVSKEQAEALISQLNAGILPNEYQETILLLQSFISTFRTVPDLKHHIC